MSVRPSGVTNIDLADSAFHAPRAGWGESDLYPDFVGKAAVLVTRLTKNHHLPDGCKRAAWVALRVFIELNDWEWVPYPSVERGGAPDARPRCRHVERARGRRVAESSHPSDLAIGRRA